VSCVVAFLQPDLEERKEHGIQGAERTLRSRDGPKVIVLKSDNANTERLLRAYGYVRSKLKLDANKLVTKRPRVLKL